MPSNLKKTSRLMVIKSPYKWNLYKYNEERRKLNEELEVRVREEFYDKAEKGGELNGTSPRELNRMINRQINHHLSEFDKSHPKPELSNPEMRFQTHHMEHLIKQVLLGKTTSKAFKTLIEVDNERLKVTSDFINIAKVRHLYFNFDIKRLKTIEGSERLEKLGLWNEYNLKYYFPNKLKPQEILSRLRKLILVAEKIETQSRQIDSLKEELKSKVKYQSLLLNKLNRSTNDFTNKERQARAEELAINNPSVMATVLAGKVVEEMGGNTHTIRGYITKHRNNQKC